MEPKAHKQILFAYSLPRFRLLRAPACGGRGRRVNHPFVVLVHEHVRCKATWIKIKYTLSGGRIGMTALQLPNHYTVDPVAMFNNLVQKCSISDGEFLGVEASEASDIWSGDTWLEFRLTRRIAYHIVRSLSQFSIPNQATKFCFPTLNISLFTLYPTIWPHVIWRFSSVFM